MEIFVGSDYRGFESKTNLLELLATSEDFSNLKVTDCGAKTYVEGDDFNEPAIRVAEKVRQNQNSFGILICDSAHGVTIQANRFKGIRAAHCENSESAKLAREHDNANVLCLSAHFLNLASIKEIVTTFLKTDFVPLERRLRRIKKLDNGVIGEKDD